MQSKRRINRRSFLSSVVGTAAAGPLLVVSDGASAGQSGCSDSDPLSRGGDPGGRGRNCANRPRTGCSDRDPTDPGGAGRNCTPTGCTDRDPTDPSGSGRNCRSSGGGASETGRRERRYEVCWVDHPSRSNDECNMQIYSEWQTTWSDGRVEYDTAEAMRRRAEMEGRGYTARWHRMLVNDWVGQ